MNVCASGLVGQGSPVSDVSGRATNGQLLALEAGAMPAVVHARPDLLGGRSLGEAAAALSPDLIATGNPGCTLQISAAARSFGYNWPIFHPIQLVDASIRGVDPRTSP